MTLNLKIDEIPDPNTLITGSQPDLETFALQYFVCILAIYEPKYFSDDCPIPVTLEHFRIAAYSTRKLYANEGILYGDVSSPLELEVYNHLKTIHFWKTLQKIMSGKLSRWGTHYDKPAYLKPAYDPRYMDREMEPVWWETA